MANLRRILLGGLIVLITFQCIQILRETYQTPLTPLPGPSEVNHSPLNETKASETPSTPKLRPVPGPSEDNHSPLNDTKASETPSTPKLRPVPGPSEDNHSPLNETKASETPSTPELRPVPVPSEDNPSHVNDPKVHPALVDSEDEAGYSNDLLALCLKKEETIVSSRRIVLSRESNMEDILAEILLCPLVEVFLPRSLRDHGYCEDGMAYVNFLQTRAMPRWIYDMEFHIRDQTYPYHQLCPNTSIILMNHYWEGVPDGANFPATKKLVLVPNIEMYELNGGHYHRVDYVLAKTKEAYKRITNWYNRTNNNPRNTQVFYTMHTSSDPTFLARTKAAESASTFGIITPKNWTHLSVFHANGRSVHKNTPVIIECWNQRPDFPMLIVYANTNGIKELVDRYRQQNRASLSNLDFHHGEFLEPAVYGKLLAQASVILCPSSMEGFGHYINQARAAGALVLTTDAPPMRELIDETSGVLISPVTSRNGPAFMGPDTEFSVTSPALCRAMDRVLAMPPEERAARARRGQERYHEQRTYFREAMRKFKSFLESKIG
eukprot:TRINITY_DN7887_c0_g1_i1.p1 TRINITY_DN7887_c0_g1~~TRINITY_DN7887_c0_g1_i1.p1  ORF type:complete len:551 (-),score=33.21 TRINITY_DN7887_c0_g1_i1:21-1673(-)